MNSKTNQIWSGITRILALFHGYGFFKLLQFNELRNSIVRLLRLDKAWKTIACVFQLDVFGCKQGRLPNRGPQFFKCLHKNNGNLGLPLCNRINNKLFNKLFSKIAVYYFIWNIWQTEWSSLERQPNFAFLPSRAFQAEATPSSIWSKSPSRVTPIRSCARFYGK